MNPEMIKSYTADKAIAPYTIVTVANGMAKKALGASSSLVGVTQEVGAEDLRRVDVTHGGIPGVKLGGTVSAGDPITSDTDGLGVAAAAGNRHIGYALADGVSGDIIDVLFAPGLS